jgi:hypothetical protein
MNRFCFGLILLMAFVRAGSVITAMARSYAQRATGVHPVADQSCAQALGSFWRKAAVRPRSRTFCSRQIADERAMRAPLLGLRAHLLTGSNAVFRSTSNEARGTSSYAIS